jgi:hypothetical protein
VNNFLFDTSSKNIQMGGTLEVPINIHTDSGTEVIGADIWMTIDESYLDVQSINQGSYFPTVTGQKTSTGKIYIAGILEDEWYRAAGFPEVQRERAGFSSGYCINTYSGDTLILARVRYYLGDWINLCERAGFVVEQVVTGEAHGAKSAGLLLRRSQPYEWCKAYDLTEAQIKAQCKRGGWWLARRYIGELQTVRLAFREQISYFNLAGWLVRPCSPTGETYKYGDAL